MGFVSELRRVSALTASLVFLVALATPAAQAASTSVPAEHYAFIETPLLTTPGFASCKQGQLTDVSGRVVAFQNEQNHVVAEWMGDKIYGGGGYQLAATKWGVDKVTLTTTKKTGYSTTANAPVNGLCEIGPGRKGTYSLPLGIAKQETTPNFIVGYLIGAAYTGSEAQLKDPSFVQSIFNKPVACVIELTEAREDDGEYPWNLPMQFSPSYCSGKTGGSSPLKAFGILNSPLDLIIGVFIGIVIVRFGLRVIFRHGLGELFYWHPRYWRTHARRFGPRWRPRG